MFCKSCGTELPTGASVCEKCGKEVQTIMVAEEPKEKTVAEPAPTVETAAPEKKKKKPDGLFLPVFLLVLSGGGLFYLYAGNTFNSIMSWFTSVNEEQNLRGEVIRTADPVEYIVNIGVCVGAVILALLGIVGLVILFNRPGRKLLAQKD